MSAGSASFLFSVDVEDIRYRTPDPSRHAPRVPETTGRYLDFLARSEAKATFFIVGDVARAHPEIVRRIAADGHEVGCHSDTHVPLDRQNPREFRTDVERNLDALHSAGAQDVRGYRAPSFSLTEATRWAYPILRDLGFLYSSSVLPARSPLYGWPAFGEAPRLVDGVVELPMTLLPSRLLPVPMGGGVYFRALPRPLLRRAFLQRRARGEPVLGYFHPYDIDEERDGFTFPGFSRFGLGHRLMHFNRAGTLSRLDMVAKLGFRISPYRSHAEKVRAALPAKEDAVAD